MHFQLIWFEGCPNHVVARTLLKAVLSDRGIDSEIEDIDASDPATATALRFAGSPTIRVDGRDIEPGFVDAGDYTPRCRLYQTTAGLQGVPERAWIEAMIGAARSGTEDHPEPHRAPRPSL
jgi:hypothetical protein